MSFNFGYIPRHIWGSGDGRYGDKDAKAKAIKMMSGESHVFVDQYLIRNYTDINIEDEKDDMDSLYKFGYLAYSIPSETAIKLLENFNMGIFDGFMLRDTESLSDESCEKHRIDDTRFGTHLVLDFDGYGSGQRTDHCYD